MSKKPDQWTPMAEAVAFISATLGEPFTTAQGHGLYWSAHASRHPDGMRGYPCGVEQLGAKLRVTISFMDAKPRATPALYAVLGWAHYHGHEVVTD